MIKQQNDCIHVYTNNNEKTKIKDTISDTFSYLKSSNPTTPQNNKIIELRSV